MVISDERKKTLAALHLDAMDYDCYTCIHKELKLSEYPCYECASTDNANDWPNHYEPDLLAIYDELTNPGLV